MSNVMLKFSCWDQVKYGVILNLIVPENLSTPSTSLKSCAQYHFNISLKPNDEYQKYL